MQTETRRFAVVAPDPGLDSSVPESRCFKTFRKPSDHLLENWSKIFVLVSLQELGSVSDFVSKANRRHHLCALLVDRSDHFDLLPQFLHHTKVRTLRNMLVHRGPEIPRRVLNSYCIGAEDELIADAEIVEDLLFVVSCASESFEVPFGQMGALREIEDDQRSDFEIAGDGSYLHWPAGDVHIDLEAVRTALDPERAKRKALQHVIEDSRLGTAVRTLRTQRGLRQRDIDGLSERQVRRIESGERPSMKALHSLAAAHGLKLGDYVHQLAEQAQEHQRTAKNSKPAPGSALSQKPKGKGRKRKKK